MSLWLGNLGSVFFLRYRRFGGIANLEKSISMFEQTTLDQPAELNNLGTSLLARYERCGDVVDLEKSLLVGEDAVRLTPDDHPEKPLWLSSLGNSLSTRYERSGDVGDLKKTVSTFEDVVRLAPDGHPKKPSWLSDFGHSLSAHYMRFGDVGYLEKSISMFENAVSLAPDSHPDKPRWLSNLGYSLMMRYERFGDAVDLKKSVSINDDAVRLTPDDHADKPLRLDNLGQSLLICYRRFGDVFDLERSIGVMEDAVRHTPDDHPHRPTWLNNLGYAVLTRYQLLEIFVDLERSITIFEDVVRPRHDHQDNSSSLNNLGISLFFRYERLRDVADLERSILLFEAALQLMPDGHPDKPARLNSLALSFLRRSQHSSDSSGADLAQAVSCSSRAACSATGSSTDRFRASQRWIECIRLLRHSDAEPLLEAYTVAIGLLPRLAWIGLSFHDRHHQLLQAANTASEAAAAALESHRPELAVEWLEQGRSIVWSQLLQLRTPVDDLRELHPELATQFEHVSRELERSAVRDADTAGRFMKRPAIQDGLLEKQAERHHALALLREDLLAQIRALPGFERFLLPKMISRLASLAHSGPVVFLNANKHRCDALIVMGGTEPALHVPLSNTSYSQVTGLQLQLKRLLQHNGRETQREATVVRPRGTSASEVFGFILPYLWDNVVKPILDVLVDPRRPVFELRRVFWCPTGPFTFLPIHAAGYYGTINLGPKLSDFVVSSYIPSMSVLELPPSDGAEATSSNIRLLAVRQPRTDGEFHLRGVEKEMGVISELSSPSPFVKFQEADGTVEDVMIKMKESDWVHFACHGTQDGMNPLDSGLLLADHRRLNVSTIVRLSRPRGGLAFLSACQTATGNEQLSEEAIHIAAGMLLAGYRGVIATMWTIMDNDAPSVAEDVYTHLFRGDKVPDSREAAKALHYAIERLRATGAPFLSWVPFIHVGL